MKYTAINIGPIVKTLGMARKPRELWAASYLFSYLMKRIVLSIQNRGVVISPATIDGAEKNGIGLYPDRIFVKGGELSFADIQEVLVKYAVDLDLNPDYFNVMMVDGEYNKDSAAIKELNKQLDVMELFDLAGGSSESVKVRELIGLKYGSELFEDAFGKKDFPIETLAEIAAVELKEENGNWSQFVEKAKSDDKKISEKAFGALPKDKLNSYHKYICVVQADGDNVGKTVSHSQLQDGKVNEISSALLEFGKDATDKIKSYGGLPIYAGGDDLLFIAPVVGKDHTNIFQLLEKLNNDSFGKVKDLVDNQRLKNENGEDIHASLSFGVSITYYKYPLYEALGNARNLLFGKAKHVEGKNAIATDWRKHSGGAFAMQFSRSKEELKKAFDKMIEASEKKVEESVVSAVAHKIKENEGILGLWIGKDDAVERNGNFFQKYLEHNPNKEKDKKTASDKYKDAALKLLNELFKTETDISKLTQTMYGMLRMAKFINGEEVIDD
jgi:CRISPR-associated protein Cmr2